MTPHEVSQLESQGTAFGEAMLTAKTELQARVIALVTRDRSINEIANLAGCSPRTVIRMTRAHGLKVKGAHGVTLEQKLHDYSARNEQTGCLEWQKSTHEFGYGKVQLGRGTMDAHRAAYLTWCGEIPAGMLVCHKCDNPPCIEPTHLFLGTSADNAADMVAKGRNAKGAQVGGRLTEEAVRAIRSRFASGADASDLAREYQTSRSNVYLVATGATWKHVEGSL